MAGTGAPEAGEVVTCPRCGREVLQKTMIPVLADAAPGVVAAPGSEQLVCVECARTFVATAPSAPSA